RHTRWPRDWSSDVCSSDLGGASDGRNTPLGAARSPESVREGEAGEQPDRQRLGREAVALDERDELAQVLGGVPRRALEQVVARRSEERRAGKEWRAPKSPQ